MLDDLVALTKYTTILLTESYRDIAFNRYHQRSSSGANTYHHIMALNYHRHRHRNGKLPLAIFLHYNTFFSIIYAMITCQLSIEKYRNYFFCNEFQRDLLLPVFFTWMIAEISRIYIGQKGTLQERLPQLAAFLLLSIFPQIFSSLYLGFLQGITMPLDKSLSCIMIVFLVIEIILAWKFLKGIVHRQTASFNNNNVARETSIEKKEDESKKYRGCSSLNLSTS